MLPNSDEKAKEPLIKKRSFSLLNKRHSRSRSSSSSTPHHESSQLPSSFNLENNKRGWLESMPVQVTPSRSLDNRRLYVAKPTKNHTTKAKDIDLLGVVSDEDIFKLTELTSRLPEVNPNKHHTRIRSDHNENITRKRMQSERVQSEDDPVIPEKVTSQHQYQQQTNEITSTAAPSITTSLEAESNEKKRRSWLYKMKPTKPRKDNQSLSVSAAIAKDFYTNNPVPINNFGRVNTVHHAKSTSFNEQQQGEPSTRTSSNRRHSYDSMQSLAQESETHEMSKEDEDQAMLNLIENKEFIDHYDQALDQSERDLENISADHSHEKRPNFHLTVSAEEEDTEQEDEDVLLELKKNGTSAVNVDTLSNHSSQDKAETFMFDYDSIPCEVQKLIDVYEDKGKAEIKELIVKHKQSINDEEGESIKDEDDEEDDDEEEMVDYHDLITGNYTTKTQKDKREIAIVTTTKSDNIEFTKLIPVSMEGSAHDGPLLDLHVSLFGENNPNFDHDTSHEEFQDTIQSIEQNLERFQSFKTNANSFLVDHLETMKSLNLYCNTDLPRNLSFPDLKSASTVEFADEPEVIDSSVIRRPMHMTRKEKYNRNTRSMYASTNEYPFDCRQKEIMTLVGSLKHELDKFKASLDKTENFVNVVQLDMDDTRNRMETYIKDIPESHYSALKKLEVDIESISSNRAKNPWIDTGYALLSYLLTLFALIVWIVIYILKMGKKTILFPKKLWTAYADYLVERNKVVKKASMNSVVGASNTDTLFGRSHRITTQDIT